MNKLFKGLIISMALCFISLDITTQVYASDYDQTEMPIELNYDLDSNEDISYVSEDGTVSVEITKEPSFYTLNNGRYKISTRRTGSWNASYTIDINNYKITSAGNASAQAVVGSFIYKKLAINDSTTATYYLTRKVGIAIYKIDFKAKIENRNLKIIVN